ncbi:MAG: hypothetical protein SGILL_010360, partial [Bacillariaceae sp.]
QVEREMESCKTRQTSVQRILRTYLDPSTSKIQYSLRPLLYDKLASLALEMKDFETLITIGEQFYDEAKKFHPKETAAVEFQRRCIFYQIAGWRGLGNSRKAEILERKHRVLLSSGCLADSMQAPKEEFEFDIQQEWDPKIPAYWDGILRKWFEVAEAKIDGAEDIAELWVSSTSK